MLGLLLSSTPWGRPRVPLALALSSHAIMSEARGWALGPFLRSLGVMLHLIPFILADLTAMTAILPHFHFNFCPLMFL